MSSLRLSAVLVVAMSFLLPAAAGASPSIGSFNDSIGDMPKFAADLGATTVTVGDDDTIVLDTRIAQRPPDYWGGCADYLGAPQRPDCAPSKASVTWYLRYSGGSGEANAKVVAMPGRDRTLWQSYRWDAGAGEFVAGAEPVAAGDPGGATWTLSLADLGIPRPATLRIWAVSLYETEDALGVPARYSDTAGPGTVSLAGPVAGTGGGSWADGSCARAIGHAYRLQRRIHRVRHGAGASRHNRLARLRARHRRALKATTHRCEIPS
jgi:hypothetical protein